MSDESRLGKWLREDNLLYLLQEVFNSRGRHKENRHWVTVNSKNDVPAEETKAVVDMFARAPDLLAEVERLRAELAMTKRAIDAISEDYRTERAAREHARDMLAMEQTAYRISVDRAERLEAALREIASETYECRHENGCEHSKRIGELSEPYAHRAALSPPVEAGEGEHEWGQHWGPNGGWGCSVCVHNPCPVHEPHAYAALSAQPPEPKR